MANISHPRMSPLLETPTGIVLRLLGGEGIDTVSQDTQIPVSELQLWVQTFVEAGASAVKRRAGRSLRRLEREERRKQESVPLEPASVVDLDRDAPRLPVAEHLHQLWITLGLGDEE